MPATGLSAARYRRYTAVPCRPQVFLQIAAIGYYSYEKDQSTAGTLIGLSCALSSIGCAVAGAYWQTFYEQELHLQHPDRFPPNPIFHAIEKIQRAREQRRARLEISQEVEEVRSQRLSHASSEEEEQPLEGSHAEEESTCDHVQIPIDSASASPSGSLPPGARSSGGASNASQPSPPNRPASNTVEARSVEMGAGTSSTPLSTPRRPSSASSGGSGKIGRISVRHVSGKDVKMGEAL